MSNKLLSSERFSFLSYFFQSSLFKHSIFTVSVPFIFKHQVPILSVTIAIAVGLHLQLGFGCLQGITTGSSSPTHHPSRLTNFDSLWNPFRQWHSSVVICMIDSKIMPIIWGMTFLNVTVVIVWKQQICYWNWKVVRLVPNFERYWQRFDLIIISRSPMSHR